MSVFDLSAEVLLLSGNTVTVTRLDALAYDANGVADVGSAVTSTFDITGVIHPMTGDDVKRLPEGLQDSTGVVVITPTELRAADTSGATPGDRFAYDGRNYEVTSAERWADLGNFFRHVALLKEHLNP